MIIVMKKIVLIPILLSTFLLVGCATTVNTYRNNVEYAQVVSYESKTFYVAGDTSKSAALVLESVGTSRVH